MQNRTTAKTVRAPNKEEAACKLGITIYYDDDCPICRTEVNHLQRQAPDKITLVAVNDAVEHLARAGINKLDAMTYLCIEDENGNWYTHMDANRLMYQTVGSKWATILALPIIKPLADAIYPIFARNRYYIPRWMTRLIFGKVEPKNACRDGVCQVPPSKR